MNRLLKDPIRLYLLWLIILVLFILAVPIISLGSPGGEQLPLTLLSQALNIGTWGFLIISLITLFFFTEWTKKHWYVPIVILLITVYMLLSVHVLNKGEETYDFLKEEKNIGGGVLIIEREFYAGTKRIRSEKFFFNGQKDSVWTTYESNGAVLNKAVYKNNVLITRTVRGNN